MMGNPWMVDVLFSEKETDDCMLGLLFKLADCIMRMIQRFALIALRLKTRYILMSLK